MLETIVAVIGFGLFIGLLLMRDYHQYRERKFGEVVDNSHHPWGAKPKAPMLPRKFTVWTAVILATQAAAIFALTYAQASSPLIADKDKGGLFLLNIVMVAFATALIVNLWDWTRRRLSRLLRPDLSKAAETQGEGLGLSRVGGRSSELPEKPDARRIG